MGCSFRRSSVLVVIGLLIAWLSAASACSSDDQSQPQAQPQAQAQGVQEQRHQQEEVTVAVQQEQPQQARASDAAAEQMQQQDQTEQQAAASEQAQEPPSQQQAQQQAQQEVTESVAEGTRLITLFGDLTEIVYALGAEAYLVARDTSSIYPPEAEALPNLGFAGGLNAEAILELEPTLVLGTPMAGPPGVLEQLEQAGVEVLIFEDVNTLEAPQIKIRRIGGVLGIPMRAEALALDVEKRLEAVMADAANDKPLSVLHVYTRRGGLQLVSGEGNRAQAMIEAAGGVDAATAAGIVGWVPLTPEALVAADPDVYLVMDRGLDVVGGVEGLLQIPGMAETRAGRGPYIISMPDLYLLGFGPRLPEAIADLTGYLRSVQAEIAGELQDETQAE